MDDIIRRLTDRDDRAAYEFAKQIAVESAQSDRYLAMIPLFAGMLTAKSAFVRTRGFFLICCQARWAEHGEIEAVWEKMIPLLNDTKPTVVRQCLEALAEVALFRPESCEKIKSALSTVDPAKYKDSMRPLIEKNMTALREML